MIASLLSPYANLLDRGKGAESRSRDFQCHIFNFCEENQMPIVTTPSGLQIEDIIVGSGPTAVSGPASSSITQAGWPTAEVRFQCRCNEPFRFPLDGRHCRLGGSVPE